MTFSRIRCDDCSTTRELLVRSIESGAEQILLEADALPPSFYDLRSGAAGDLLQGLVNNRIRTAVVVSDLTLYTDAFRAFVEEANRGRAFRFFESDAAAEDWLREDSEP